MSGAELAALVVMVLGSILTIVCVALPYWKRNDPEDTNRDNIVRHEGLWIKCQTFSSGNWDCDDFNRFFLGLPSELQAARGFSLTSVVLAIFAIGAMCVGMDSLPCSGDNKGTKKRVRLVAGSLSALSGLLLVAAVSWYANDVRIAHELATLQIQSRNSSVTRYIFGSSLFVGWVGGVMLFLAGIIAVCTGCGRSYEDTQPRYAYKPPIKTLGGGIGGQEYV